MKIERLHIAHFGKFNDYTLAFEDRFSVFYGDNEDGKSTILECLRMLFYGSTEMCIRDRERIEILQIFTIVFWKRERFGETGMGLSYGSHAVGI